MNTKKSIAILDKKYASNWGLYRGEKGAWTVSLPNPTGVHSRDTIKGLSMSKALANAAAHVVLPIIPRQPEAVSRRDFVIKKSKGEKYFQVFHQDHNLGNGDSVKSNLKKQIGEAVARVKVARAKWREAHGDFVATHSEGVDYVYREKAR